MDIDELEKKYPFLKKVLKAYKEYEEPLAKDPDLDTFYNTKIMFGIRNDKETYKDICIKLLRNLKLLKDRNYLLSINEEHCTYLYHWLYTKTKGSSINNMLISIIFDDFHKKMAGLSEQTICPYALYKKELYESKNLAKLSYLKHNFENIKSILMDPENEHYCYCQNYLKDCVDIYRVMNVPFCTNGGVENKYNESICTQLREFQTYYSFFRGEAEIEKRIPNIESGKRTEELSGCSSNNETSVPEPPANTDASKSNTSSTVIGSMVGIPPFLVLIYKFTPVGKFFRFGNKNNTKITSNFDKEIENELLQVIQKDSNIKDIHSKYNIGYEPI